MIIVEKPPTIIPSTTCPVTRVRVINQLGKTLRIASYDMITNSLIGEYTESITSNDQIFTVAWATPTTTDRTVILAVLEVRDTTLVEKWSSPFLYVPISSFNYSSDKVDVVYISKYGLTKFDSQVNYYYLDQSLITILKKPGYIAIYDGSNKVVEASGKSALITLRFNIPRNLANLFANYVDNPDISTIVFKEPSLTPYVGSLAFIKSVVNSLRFTNVGTVVYESEDGNNIIVECSFYVDLYSSFDWRNILALVTGIIAIVTGFILMLTTSGVSIPLSYALISAGLAIASGSALTITTLSLSESPSYVVSLADKITAESINKISKYVNDVNTYIDYLVSQGKLTNEESQKLKSYINDIVDTASSSIKELNELVKKAYDEGYRKGLDEGKTWIVVSGLVGCVGGYMLGSRGGRGGG